MAIVRDKSGNSPQVDVDVHDNVNAEESLNEISLISNTYTDLTSMFVGRDGSGGNPEPGSTIGLVLNKAGMGGQTAEAYNAGLPNLYPGTKVFVTGFVDNGDGSYTNSGTTSEARFLAGDGVLEENEFYQIAFDTITDGGITIIVGGTSITGNRFSVANTSGQVQSFSGIVRAENTVFDAVRFASSANCTISNISIKRIPGEHLKAPADNQRPVLRKWPVTGRRNLLTYTEDLTDAVWLRGGVTRSLSAQTGPNGYNAWELTSSVPDATIFQPAYASEGDVVIAHAKVKRLSGLDTLDIKIRRGDTSGAFISETFTLTDGWQHVTVTGTVPSGLTSVQICIGGAGSFSTGESILVSELQLEIGTTATPYQAVYNENHIEEAGVPSVYSPNYDGVDDGLTYTFPGGSGPADCSIFAAMKTSDLIAVMFSEDVGSLGVGIWQDASTSTVLTNAGSVYVDGVLQSGNRDALTNVMAVDKYVIVEIRGADLSGWNEFKTSLFGGTYQLYGQLIGPIIVETSLLEQIPGYRQFIYNTLQQLIGERP